MLSQARFPREEAKVEICRQKSMWGGGVGLGMDCSGERRRKLAEERWAVTGLGWPAADSQGSSRAGMMLQVIPVYREGTRGLNTPSHCFTLVREVSCCSGRRGYNLRSGVLWGWAWLTWLLAVCSSWGGGSHSPEGSWNDVTIAILCAHAFIFSCHQCLNLLWYRFCMLRLKIMESNFHITWNNCYHKKITFSPSTCFPVTLKYLPCEFWCFNLSSG